MEPSDKPAFETYPPQPAPLPPPSPLQPVFMGPNGLRAGWRFAIYVGCVFSVLVVLSWVIRPLLPSNGRPLWVTLVGEGELMAAGFIPAIVIARFEKRRFGDYGLPDQDAFGRNFWWGVLWGIVAITVLLAMMRGIGVFYFGHLALHGMRILKFAAFWGLFFLLVGFAEEFITRGYSQFTLAQGMGFWPAAILLSVAFGAIHLTNAGEEWVGALGAACIGMFFCLTLCRTGNLWFAVGMHASWDWGESFLYSVPDSGAMTPGHLMNPSFHGSRWLTGGSVGPEGSVLVFVLIAAMWVIFDRMYPAASRTRSQAGADSQQSPI